MKLIALASCLVLSACGAPTKVVMQPQEVLVPVVTRCKVKYPVKPPELTAERIPSGFYERVVLILKENVDYRQYSLELEAALGACADPS